MKKILSLILCFMLFSAPVFGAETMDVLYSYDENKITVNASTDTANADVAIYVLPEGTTPSSMSDSLLPIAAEYIRADSEGKILNYDIYFSNQQSVFPYGNYTVYMYYGNAGTQNDSFAYLNETDRLIAKKQEITDAAAAASDWNELKTVIMGTDDNGNTVNDYNGYISPNYTYYSSLTSKSQVFIDMFARKGEIVSFDDIARLFLEISLSCYNDENTPSQGGGFQGGGSGGGGGSISAGSYPVKPEEKEEEIPKEYFTDMQDHWARETVYEMAKIGIVNGFENGRFLPEESVTRAEFTKMAVCAFGLLKEAPNVFEDIKDGDWYEEYISAAACAGVVSGSDGKFRPNDEITREDACVILYNILSKAGKLSPESKTFGDMEDISGYAREAVSVLAANSVVSGTEENIFSPKKNTTRAEAATLIYRAREL